MDKKLSGSKQYRSYATLLPFCKRTAVDIINIVELDT